MKRLFIYSISIIILFLIIISIPSCTPKNNNVLKTYIRIPMGVRENTFKFSKELFLGHRVDSFRVKLRVVNPGRTQNWINSLSLKFSQFRVIPVYNHGFRQSFNYLPSTADNLGFFWTKMIPGNRIIMSGSTNYLANYEGGSPRIEIVEIERYLDPLSESTDIPAFDQQPKYHYLYPNIESIVQNPAPLEYLHFKIDVSDYKNKRMTLYLSPLCLSLSNDIDLRLCLSSTGFYLRDDSTSNWIKPEKYDTGIYHEFNVSSDAEFMYLTVFSALSAPIFVNFTEQIKTYKDIVVERDENISTPLAVNLLELETITSNDFPYGYQLSRYIKNTADIDFRIQQMFVFTSAYMLDATDGAFRIESVEHHPNIKLFRNVDVQIEKGEGRAYAKNTRVNLYESYLSDPRSCGWTMHHEWAHYSYDMPDEYIDVESPPDSSVSPKAICPNSLMAARVQEFCYDDNHIHIAGENCRSMWKRLNDKYSIYNNGYFDQVRYFDVLHKLDKLLEFKED